MMNQAPKTPAPLPEMRDVTVERFRHEILPAGRPVVLRGAVSGWPVIAAGRSSPAALSAYLRRFDAGLPVRAMLGPPGIEGRFFYDADLTGFNFRADQVTLAAALDLLLNALDDARPTALALQSVPVRANLPGFETDNAMPLLSEAPEPRVWIGNRVTVAAHHDPSENIACVVAGRRRFTLFPPDQVANLYPGPFERTPAGPTISMVDFRAPDLTRYPRFADAMATAQSAELEPGDALYIPYLWWHHVQSIDAMNMLVNYWWTPPGDHAGHPIQALLHAMVAVKNLPGAHRQSWRALFDHYVFQDHGAPGAHLPIDRRGIQGALDPELMHRVRVAIAETLKR
ncbi:MAG: cupin-like domain-containing protein [Sphingomonas sp.]